jgi:hypothetical protein
MPFAMEQLSQGLSIAARIDAHSLVQNTSVNGIDASKFRRMMAAILVGAGGGNITAKLQAAPAPGGAFTDVAGSTRPSPPPTSRRPSRYATTSLHPWSVSSLSRTTSPPPSSPARHQAGPRHRRPTACRVDNTTTPATERRPGYSPGPSHGLSA